MRQGGFSTVVSIVILAALIVVVVILVPGQKAGEPQDKQELAEETENEDLNLPPASSFPDIMGDKSDEKVMAMKENAVIEKIFNDENSQMALLGAVDDSASSGTGYRLVSVGKLYHAVIATMAEPQKGNVYEGWLVQPTPLKFFSTGVMKNPEEGVWTLEYTSDNEYSTYTRVVITEETVVDDIPERHIIEGDF